jgi:hypothetical protein
MSNVKEYQEKLEEIKQIPDDKIEILYMPLDHYMLEADGTYTQALKDKEALVKAGIPEELIHDLAKRVGACRQAQSNWIDKRNKQKEAEKKWSKRVEIAYELRTDMIHGFRYAYRNYPDLLNQVSYIAKDYGHADLIQDMNDLSTMGRNNPEPLKAIGFNMDLLDQAAKMSGELSELLNQANGDRWSNDEAKIIRDKAYTYLKQAVDEIRECGKYLFWRDEERLKWYTSEYIRQRRQKDDYAEHSEISEEKNDSADLN